MFAWYFFNLIMPGIIILGVIFLFIYITLKDFDKNEEN